MDEFFERRLPTPAELADLVKWMRENHKLSQATLAEIAGITERTIQRVENAEPSSLDTRRAIAGAFGFEDNLVFDKPGLWGFNPERWKAHLAELDKTTTKVSITRVREGRTLRTMVEGASAFAAEEVGELSRGAREAFAEMVDYLRDYNDICSEYSMRQRLEVDDDLDAFLNTIAKERAAIGVGVRHGKFRSSSADPELPALDLTIIQFMLAPHDALPSTVRVPKSFRFE
jgi:transcriptional regulator with XRE-family HTH domain